MKVYKQEEGMWARMPAAIIGGIITVIATRAAMNWGKVPASYIWGGLAFAAFGGITLFFAFFHRKTSDVLIDTENELRKVVWPTREEVTGSTIVVIGTTVILALLIFVIDVVFARVLNVIGLY